MHKRGAGLKTLRRVFLSNQERQREDLFNKFFMGRLLYKNRNSCAEVLCLTRYFTVIEESCVN
jgi:hypothetical protein